MLVSERELRADLGQTLQAKRVQEQTSAPQLSSSEVRHLFNFFFSRSSFFNLGFLRYF